MAAFIETTVKSSHFDPGVCHRAHMSGTGRRRRVELLQIFYFRTKLQR